MPGLWSRIRSLVRYGWASPLILIGFLLAAPLAFTGALRWKRGVFVIIDSGTVGKWFAARGWAGFSLGICVFLWLHDNPVVEFHERIHVRQTLTWGLLFPLIYFASLALHGYKDSYFEREAYSETAEWVALRE